jgi:site-specific recombinase XerD
MKGCRALSEVEVVEVAKSFGGVYAARDKALFVLGVKSGFRISELLSLTIGDVYQHGQWVDRVAVQRKHMKGKHQGRSVPLHSEAKAALAPWLMELQRLGAGTPDRYLFPSRKGVNRPLRRGQAWAILHQAYEANELTGPLGTHTMRKTFATKVYEATGKDLRSTQHALGHKSPASTAAYLAVDEAAVDAVILAL